MSIRQRNTKPIFVLLSILITGGLLGFYWAYRISGDYITSKKSELSVIDYRLIKYRTLFKIITIIHFIYWPLLVIFLIMHEGAEVNKNLSIFTIIGIIEIFLLYCILVKLEFFFEMAITNEKPSYFTILCLTVIYFISIVRMQHIYNLYSEASNVENSEYINR